MVELTYVKPNFQYPDGYETTVVLVLISKVIDPERFIALENRRYTLHH